MDYVSIIGFAAAFGTTTAFAPQVYRAWKLKHTKDISLTMYIIFVTGVVLWLVYGILIDSKPIIVANVVTSILAGSVLLLKLKYG